MVEALKKLDKKFLIIAGCLLGLPIIIIVFLALIRGCSSESVTYERYESNMLSAAQKYVKREKIELTSEGETAIITLDELVDKELIKSTSSTLKDDSCSGKVTVRRNGSSVEANKGGYLQYLTDLQCDKYSTNTLYKTLTKSIVTTESGLYEYNDEYVFRGDKVNNYLKMLGDDYRIISVGKDQTIRLIRTLNENIYRPWDNKFNVDTNRSTGKNIYKDSYILEYLISNYTNTKKFNAKSIDRIIAHDVCIGKRSINNYSIDRSIDCSEKLEKQLISLLNVSDYALASIDPDCNNVISRSCKNYNYLSDVSTAFWTSNAVAENSYEVFALSDGLVEHKEANQYDEYSLVIYIDGNETNFKGEGTELNPYVIE